MTYLSLAFLDPECLGGVTTMSTWSQTMEHSTLTSPASLGHTHPMNFHCTFETHQQEDVLFPECTPKNKCQKDPQTAETTTPCSFLDLITPPTSPDQDGEAPKYPFSLWPATLSDPSKLGERKSDNHVCFMYICIFFSFSREEEGNKGIVI